MNAINFIQQHGVEKARGVVEGAPDKTASHYVISKRSHYYSVDFQSYFNNGDWYDSDYTSAQDLANDYEPQNVIRLSDLKRIVESVDLIGKYHSIDHAKNHYNNMREALNQYQYENKEIEDLSNELKQAIADYEQIFGNTETLEKSPLMQHLDKCEEVVKTWPKWKLQSIRDAFGIPVLDNDMGDDSHIENHVSPNCKKFDERVK